MEKLELLRLRQTESKQKWSLQVGIKKAVNAAQGEWCNSPRTHGLQRRSKRQRNSNSRQVKNRLRNIGRCTSHFKFAALQPPIDPVWSKCHTFHVAFVANVRIQRRCLPVWYLTSSAIRLVISSCYPLCEHVLKPMGAIHSPPHPHELCSHFGLQCWPSQASHRESDSIRIGDTAGHTRRGLTSMRESSGTVQCFF